MILILQYYYLRFSEIMQDILARSSYYVPKAAISIEKWLFSRNKGLP